MAMNSTSVAAPTAQDTKNTSCERKISPITAMTMTTINGRATDLHQEAAGGLIDVS
jgi:hypothetical protein